MKTVLLWMIHIVVFELFIIFQVVIFSLGCAAIKTFSDGYKAGMAGK